MEIHVCILAAGQSKRMKSKLSKLLHPLCGRPMIRHVLAAVQELRPAKIGVVVGFQRESVIAALENNVEFVVQEQQLGTAHAVRQFLDQFPEINGNLLVLNGDTPLITPALLQKLFQVHGNDGAVITLVTTDLDEPKGYGRIVRAADKSIEKIVEEADANDREKKIHEVNAGIYLFAIGRLRELLPRVSRGNKQQEYYLPDVIPLALQSDDRVLAIPALPEEVIGINTRSDLAKAEHILQMRINEQWMLRGVTMRDPERTYIGMDVELESEVILYPNVVLEGATRIGPDVTIYPNCRISDSYVDGECVIYDNTVVESSHIARGVSIGPFARLRPKTYLQSGARIGNFVELKNTTVGEGSKANHLSYLGDATIGRNVNVGAGTITCNYDGEKKHPTTIEDEVFIGSDTQLIAPVTVGKGAYVAAGSSITEDVPPGSLGIARARQVNKGGWAGKKQKKK